MKRMLNQVLAVMLTCVLTVTGITWNPAAARAATSSYGKSAMPSNVDVIVENAPLRTGPGKAYDVVARTYAGRVLKVVDQTVNSYGNVWYEVGWESELGDGETAYIYSGNVTYHTHGYMCVEVQGTDYHVCECGDVYLETVTYEEQPQVLQGNALVLDATATWGVAGLADGPLPVGDILGALIFAGAVCYTFLGTVPATLTEITTKTDFQDYLNDRDNVCNNMSFYRVERLNGQLVKLDGTCLDLAEAFVYTRYCGGDVWTSEPTGTNAMACAAMNGEFFGPEVDKNKPGYYMHYHMGTDRTATEQRHTVGGHVFYGAAVGTGETPH